MFSVLLLFLTGCSDKKEVSEETPEVENETVPQEKEKEEEHKEVEVKGEVSLTEIESLKIPETLEDLANSTQVN